MTEELRPVLARVTDPSAGSVLLATIAERHHDVEIEWSQHDDGEPWLMRATFVGSLYEDALLELIEWAQRFGGNPEHAMFRITAGSNPVATVRVWPA